MENTTNNGKSVASEFPGAYMDVFRGKPVVHIPMNPEQTYFFSFGIEKAEIINTLVVTGAWQPMIAKMRKEAERLKAKKIQKEQDVIQL